MPDEIKEKYGFKVGERVLWTSTITGETEIHTIKAFDPYPDQGKGLLVDDGSWDLLYMFSKIIKVGEQLEFEFMRE